jgi:hypothetical protein
MQMVQFVVGLLAGFSYIFIKYDVPILHPLDHPISAFGARSEGIVTRSTPVKTANQHQLEATWESQNLQHGIAHHTIPCLSNPGQVFVFWLGAIYVIPLIYLFAQFFSKSYKQTAKIKRL